MMFIYHKIPINQSFTTFFIYILSTYMYFLLNHQKVYEIFPFLLQKINFFLANNNLFQTRMLYSNCLLLLNSKYLY